MITDTHFKISVPRFRRSPIDTYIFSQAVKRMADDYFTRQKSMSRKGYIPSLKVTKIGNAIKKETGIDPLKETTDRHGEYVMARQLFLHFVRRHLKYSQTRTGMIIGKDHCTVIHADKCVNKFKVIEPKYAELYNRLDSKILEIINQ